MQTTPSSKPNQGSNRTNNSASESPWRAELKYIERAISEGNISITDIVSALHRRSIEGYFEGTKNHFNHVIANKLKLRCSVSGNPILRVGVVHGCYVLLPSHINNELIAPSVFDIVNSDVDAVVDLGCGWGRNLFHIRQLTKESRPDLKFFGCEISEDGRKAGALLSQLDPSFDVEFIPFDFNIPNFSFLGAQKNIVAFTCHAIEQVQDIGRGVFESLASSCPKVRCIHAEPIGWQFEDKIMSRLDSEEKTFLKIDNEKFLVGGPVNHRISAFTAVFSGWNMNLKAILDQLSETEVINIQWVEKDICGDTFYNPTTMICWHN